MLDHIDSINWSTLARPYGQAERALGRLAHALLTTTLHSAWLWRELTRVSVLIVQASGYQAQLDQLRMVLIGAPLNRDDHTSGLAAATRVFLAAAPLFRTCPQADSKTELWPRFWDQEPVKDENGGQPASDLSEELGGEGEGGSGRRQLVHLVDELSSFADDGRRPALINLFVDLRNHAATRHLSPQQVRIALPLALAKSGLVPKAAPGLLGGRRLPLGMSRAVIADKPLTEWLVLALDALAKEADQSYQRLVELTRQHQAWHVALARVGLRRHARSPDALALLAATPVLTIGLVAHHLGCTHPAAGKIIERLVELGILIERTSRSRHKVFVAGDLSAAMRGETDVDALLSLSEAAPAIDVDALGVTLDGLFADLDRLSERTKTTLAAAGSTEGKKRAGG